MFLEWHGTLVFSRETHPPLLTYSAPPAAQVRVVVKHLDENVRYVTVKEMTETCRDAAPHCMLNGTREALLRGTQQYRMSLRNLWQQPSLHLGGTSGLYYAISDPTAQLADRTCVVYAEESRPLEGDVAVWRYPLMLPGDIQVWTAVTPKLSQFPLPRAGILCSRKGLGILALAGGDYDGDTLFVSNDKVLLRLVRDTEDAVKILGVETLETGIRKKLPGKETDEAEVLSARSVLQSLQQLHASNLRGTISAMAARAQQGAINYSLRSWATEEMRRRSLTGALHLGVLAHVGYDAPKKFEPAHVLSAAYEKMKDLGLNWRSLDAKEEAKKSFRSSLVKLPHFATCAKTCRLSDVAAGLNLNLDFGKTLWPLPLSEAASKVIYLDSGIGAVMRKLILDRKKTSEAFAIKRVVRTSPAKELAYFLWDRVCSAGKERELLRCLENGTLSMETVTTTLGSSRGRKKNVAASLYSSGLF